MSQSWNIIELQMFWSSNSRRVLMLVNPYASHNLWNVHDIFKLLLNTITPVMVTRLLSVCHFLEWADAANIYISTGCLAHSFLRCGMYVVTPVCPWELLKSWTYTHGSRFALGARYAGICTGIVVITCKEFRFACARHTQRTIWMVVCDGYVFAMVDDY